jgi:hypothetical protein
MLGGHCRSMLQRLRTREDTGRAAAGMRSGLQQHHGQPQQSAGGLQAVMINWHCRLTGSAPSQWNCAGCKRSMKTRAMCICTQMQKCSCVSSVACALSSRQYCQLTTWSRTSSWCINTMPAVSMAGGSLRLGCLQRHASCHSLLSDSPRLPELPELQHSAAAGALACSRLLGCSCLKYCALYLA